MESPPDKGGWGVFEDRNFQIKPVYIARNFRLISFDLSLDLWQKIEQRRGGRGGATQQT